MATAVISELVDATGGSAVIEAAIDSLNVGSNQRVGSYTTGHKVRFYKYIVA